MRTSSAEGKSRRRPQKCSRCHQPGHKSRSCIWRKIALANTLHNAASAAGPAGPQPDSAEREAVQSYLGAAAGAAGAGASGGCGGLRPEAGGHQACAGGGAGPAGRCGPASGGLASTKEACAAAAGRAPRRQGEGGVRYRSEQQPQQQQVLPFAGGSDGHRRRNSSSANGAPGGHGGYGSSSAPGSSDGSGPFAMREGPCGSHPGAAELGGYAGYEQQGYEALQLCAQRVTPPELHALQPLPVCAGPAFGAGVMQGGAFHSGAGAGVGAGDGGFSGYALLPAPPQPAHYALCAAQPLGHGHPPPVSHHRAIGGWAVGCTGPPGGQPFAHSCHPPVGVLRAGASCCGGGSLQAAPPPPLLGASYPRGGCLGAYATMPPQRPQQHGGAQLQNRAIACFGAQLGTYEAEGRNAPYCGAQAGSVVPSAEAIGGGWVTPPLAAGQPGTGLGGPFCVDAGGDDQQQQQHA